MQQGNANKSDIKMTMPTCSFNREKTCSLKTIEASREASLHQKQTIHPPLSLFLGLGLKRRGWKGNRLFAANQIPPLTNKPSPFVVYRKSVRPGQRMQDG